MSRFRSVLVSYLKFRTSRLSTGKTRKTRRNYHLWSPEKLGKAGLSCRFGKPRQLFRGFPSPSQTRRYGLNFSLLSSSSPREVGNFPEPKPDSYRASPPPGSISYLSASHASPYAPASALWPSGDYEPSVFSSVLLRAVFFILHGHERKERQRRTTRKTP